MLYFEIYFILLCCTFYECWQKHCIFQSETYETIDAIFRDGGTSSDHNDNWTAQSQLQVVRGDNYTTLSETGTASAYYRANNGNEFIDDFVIEFDLHSIPNNKNYWLFTGTLDTSFRMDNLNISTDAHIKMVVTGLTYLIYVDDTQLGSERAITNRSATDGLQFRFQLNDGANDLKYSNFVIYPI